MWVYIRTESTLWTVGFYDPKGNWHPDSDWDHQEDAAKRVAYLNGSEPPAIVTPSHIIRYGKE